MVFEDGSRKEINTLPYFDKCKEDEIIIAENKVPDYLCGNTISFLSADKTLQIFVGDEEIYSFGIGDERKIGHTPGSIMVFADIPADAYGKTIKIVMQSHFEDFATYMTSIKVADRDIAILKYIELKLFDVMCCVIIFICGLVIIILAIIQKLVNHKTDGLFSLGAYLMLISVYHIIETKVLTVFYGNQYLYSNLVFIILMTAPLLFENLLYEKAYGVRTHAKLLMIASIANIVGQVTLQCLNIFDFMDMAVISHFILGVAVITAFYSQVMYISEDGKMNAIIIGVFFMTLGAVTDIVRTYIDKVGDFGKFSRYGVCVFAITEIVTCMQDMIKSQIELAETARIQADNANKAKSQFLANMSHEIRTPINGILGMDAMIMKECTDSSQLEYALNIQHASQNLLAIVNDILDISKIEAGKMDIVPVEYELQSMLNDCYQLVAGRASDKGLYFNMQIAPDLPSGLKGDEVRIRQIINKLLSNAVKYTHEGGFTLKLSGGKKEGNTIDLCISVKDTGMGIKKHELNKLFNSYTRMDQEKNRNIEGTGLGLNLTKNLVELMNGTITVDSVYGQGSEFKVVIPQFVINNTPINDWSKSYNSMMTLKDKEVVELYAPGAHILVVDDVEMNLKVVQGLLKDTYIKIDTALNGIKAISMIRQKHYDLILLDHMMPELDGVETLKRIKALKDNPNKDTPVIMLTANAVVGVREEYLKEGFTDYLSKPIFENKLKRTIIKYISEDLVQHREAEEEIVEEAKNPYQAISGDLSMEKAFATYGIDFKSGMAYCMDNIELYKEIVESFVKDNLMNQMIEQFEDSNWVEYRTIAHSIKSSANTIGAKELGEKARLLEYAARDVDVEYIKAHHQEVVEKYMVLIRQLSDFMG